MRHHVAYVDDKESNLDSVKLILEKDFEMATFLRPEEFLETFPDSTYTCILTDIYMPSMNGYDLYEKIIGHPHYNGCPILFISSDESDAVRINALALGAVDFINRTMRPEEMLVRIRSRIQFFEKHRTIIEFGNLKVNLTLLKASIDDQPVPLTFIEFKLLYQVLRAYPELMSKEQITNHVWGKGPILDATIHTHISNLNGKLRKWDHEIANLRQRGFILAPKEG